MKRLHVLLVSLFIWSGGYAQELVKFFEEGKFGFRDKATDQVVVTPKYDQANNFSEGLAAVSQNRKWGYIDKTGNEVIPLIYVIAADFSEGLAPVSLEAFGNRGFIDQTGEIVISLKYRDIMGFSEGLAAVKIGEGETGKWGYVDKAGNEVIPPVYDHVEDFSEGIAWVMTGGKYGYVDKTGAEYLKFDGIQWENGRWQAKVWFNGKQGLIDRAGNEISPLQYPSQEEQAIWERFHLADFIEQVKSYDKESGESGIFQIHRPCYILDGKENGLYVLNPNLNPQKNPDQFSSSDFDPEVSTIIFKFDRKEGSRTYTLPDNNMYKVTINSYSSFLIYYDVKMKKCVGHDEIPALPLPSNLSQRHLTPGDYTENWSNDEEIRKRIDSRLTAP